MPRPAKIKISPRKTPVQDRSKKTVEIILQAATRVLGRESLSGFNTNRVAQVAGLSVGSLYQYFPNKDALITELIRQEHLTLASRFTALIDKVKGKSAAFTLSAIVAAVIDQQFANPVFAAALDHEEKRLPLDAALADVHATLLASAAILVKPHYPKVTKLELLDCMVILQAMVDHCALHSLDAPTDLEDRVSRALMGYLGLASAAKPVKQNRRSAVD